MPDELTWLMDARGSSQYSPEVSKKGSQLAYINVKIIRYIVVHFHQGESRTINIFTRNTPVMYCVFIMIKA